VVTVCVQLIAVLLLYVVSLDVRMFGAYLPTLLWAILLSLPLRRIKTACLVFAFGSAATRRRMLTGLCAAALGPIWTAVVCRWFPALASAPSSPLRSVTPVPATKLRDAKTSAAAAATAAAAMAEEPASAPYFRLLWRAALAYGIVRLARLFGWTATLCGIATLLTVSVGGIVVRRCCGSRKVVPTETSTDTESSSSSGRRPAMHPPQSPRKQRASASEEEADKSKPWPAFMDTLAAVLLIVLFLVAAVGLSALLVVQIGKESAALYVDTRNFVGASLPNDIGSGIRETCVVFLILLLF